MATKKKSKAASWLKKKQDMKDQAGKELIYAGLRQGTTVAAAYGVTQLAKKTADKPINKFYGGILQFIDVAVQCTVEDPMLRNIAAGAGSYGAVYTAGQLLKDSKADFGLAGIEDEMSGIGDTEYIDATPSADSFLKLAAAAEPSSNMSGIGEIQDYDDFIAGLSGDGNEETYQDPMSGVEEDPEMAGYGYDSNVL
jgi:hypothetical protein